MQVRKKTSDRRAEGIRTGCLTMMSISTQGRPLNPTCLHCLTVFYMHNSPPNYLIINGFIGDTMSL